MFKVRYVINNTAYGLKPNWRENTCHFFDVCHNVNGGHIVDDSVGSTPVATGTAVLQ